MRGLVYTLVGLTIFLTGVYSGFLDMGQLIGRSVAARHGWLLPVVGFFIGMIVVLVEPAVIVLGQQIEETTGGRIPAKIIKATLSIGVALAVMFTLRIMIPEVKLWHFCCRLSDRGYPLQVRPRLCGHRHDGGGPPAP